MGEKIMPKDLKQLRSVVMEVEKGQIQPVYLFQGNDQYLQKFVVEKIESALFPEGMSEKIILEPNEMSGNEIIEKLYASDLFSRKKIFVLRNLQNIQTSYQKNIFRYCEKPIQLNCLVIILEDFDQRKAIVKELITGYRDRIKKINEHIDCSLWLYSKEHMIMHPDLRCPKGHKRPQKKNDCCKNARDFLRAYGKSRRCFKCKDHYSCKEDHNKLNHLLLKSMKENLEKLEMAYTEITGDRKNFFISKAGIDEETGKLGFPDKLPIITLSSLNYGEVYHSGLDVGYTHFFSERLTADINFTFFNLR